MLMVLSVTFNRMKKLKETLVAIQQLDKNMSILRSWLAHIESELSKAIVYETCDSEEIQRKLNEQQVKQKREVEEQSKQNKKSPQMKYPHFQLHNGEGDPSVEQVWFCCFLWYKRAARKMPLNFKASDAFSIILVESSAGLTSSQHGTAH